MTGGSPTDAAVRARLSAGALSFLERFSVAYVERDLEAMAELFHADAEIVDHRLIGWEPVRGWPAIREVLAAHLAMTEGEPHVEGEMLDATPDGDAYLSRDVWTGRTTFGGGDAESQRYVVDITRDGRLLREEMFEDEQSARAAFAALMPSAAPPA